VSVRARRGGLLKMRRLAPVLKGNFNLDALSTAVVNQKRNKY
jgi:hypothetical protein